MQSLSKERVLLQEASGTWLKLFELLIKELADWSEHLMTLEQFTYLIQDF